MKPTYGLIIQLLFFHKEGLGIELPRKGGRSLNKEINRLAILPKLLLLSDHPFHN